MSAWRFCTLSKVNLRSTHLIFSVFNLFNHLTIISAEDTQLTSFPFYQLKIIQHNMNIQPTTQLSHLKQRSAAKSTIMYMPRWFFLLSASQSVSHCQATNSKYNNMMWLGEIIEQTAIQLRKCNLISINKRKSSLYTRRRWSSGSSISNQPLSIRLPYRSIMMLF